MLGLCSRTIRENNYENDDFLTYVCFELFKKQQYDKVILTYLANYLLRGYFGYEVSLERSERL